MKALAKISYVDKDKCTACEKCVMVCPEDCFSIVEDKGKVIAKFTDNGCTNCGACLKACPEDAIVVSITKGSKKKEYYIMVDENKCEACGECVKICPECNLEIVETEKKIHSMHKDKMHKCNKDHKCVFVCKCNAIKLKEVKK